MVLLLKTKTESFRYLPLDVRAPRKKRKSIEADSEGLCMFRFLQLAVGIQGRPEAVSEPLLDASGIVMILTMIAMAFTFIIASSLPTHLSFGGGGRESHDGNA